MHSFKRALLYEFCLLFLCSYIQAASGQWTSGLIKSILFLYFTNILYEDTSEHSETFLIAGLVYQKIVF